MLLECFGHPVTDKMDSFPNRGLKIVLVIKVLKKVSTLSNIFFLTGMSNA